MNYTKCLVIIIFPVLMIFAFINCGKKEPILIGFSGNLSGRLSEIGISARNGLELAIDEINHSGGINGCEVKLIIKDDKANPEEAIKVDKELQREGCKLIIGHLISGAINNKLEEINKLDVVYLSPTMSSENFSDKKDNFFRVISSNKDQGLKLAENAIKNNVKTMAVIYDYSNDPYSMDLVKYFCEKYTSLGGQIIYKDSFFTSNKIDFDKLINQILKARPQGLMTSASSVDNAVICQQLTKSNSTIPVYTGNWALTSDLILHGGKSVERIVSVNVFDPNSNNPKFILYKNKYINKYESEPTFSSNLSYECGMIIKRVLENINDITTSNIKNKLLSIRKFDGLQGEIEFNNYGDVKRDYLLITIRNNRFIKMVNNE